MGQSHTNYINKVLTHGVELSAADAYILGEPKHLVLSHDEYQKLLEGDINWRSKLGHENTFNGFDDIGKGGLVIVNKENAVSDKDFVGRYITVGDNTGCEPTNIAAKSIYVKSFKEDNATSWINVPSTVLSFSTSGEDSLSDDLKQRDSDQGTVHYNDSLTVDIIEIKKDKKDVNKLIYELSERHIGSLDYYHQNLDTDGGNKITYLQDTIDVNSKKISILVNPYFTKNVNTWRDDNNEPVKSVRVYSTVADYGSLGGYESKYSKYHEFVKLHSLPGTPTVSADTLTESMFLSGYINGIDETDALNPGNNIYNLSRYGS